MAKFKKINFKSKSLWKKIGLGVLAGVVLIGAVFGVTALFRKAEEETQKEISPTYAIGGLTETGAYLETKESIYTKDAFECQGLNVKLAFDNNISYRIFFYDYDDNFVSSTSKLTTNYDEGVSVFVKSARIVITPNEDSKISWYEKSGYAKQLTINVDKEQKEYSFSEDLWKTSSTMTAKDFYATTVKTSYSQISTTTDDKFSNSELINVVDYDYILVYGDIDFQVNCHYWGANKTLLEFVSYSTGNSAWFDYNGNEALLLPLSADCVYFSTSIMSVGNSVHIVGVK